MSIEKIEFAIAHARLAAQSLNDVVEEAHAGEFPKGVVTSITGLMDLANTQEQIAAAQALLIYMIVMNLSDG